MKFPRVFLMAAGVGLTPIALSYGLKPEASLAWLFDIPVTGTNTNHLFRAIMGLYLALTIFWIMGAFRSRLTLPALWSLVVFMWGLAAGRILSVFVDGIPSTLLLIYLGLELAFGAVGWVLLSKMGAPEHAQGRMHHRYSPHQ